MSAVDDFYASLARTRLGAGALITDGDGRVLMVEPTYKQTWEIPGGAVERGEGAPAACVREVGEELGLTDFDLGRLLVIDHQQDPPPRGDSVMFVYELGLPDGVMVRLAPDELRSYAYFHPDELDTITSARLAGRVRMALAARSEGVLIESINGERRRSPAFGSDGRSNRWAGHGHE
ncbi:NUDIX hydrolase [Tsukamurella sp. 8F]|uniref:NUDIX domain-containing protein n=1 Tax=unclassified Tsukamurella TaxID=2633480 RepID=UPI0023BA2BE5|nr:MULTISPECIES: NUDIX hydrolase [unclassified Tsukamurella]MDF0532401.1 NUDIX hydrolase [Tsukamurella sp. 8J]MDF0588613.1 NUDIX hydrolase [Tsukamurella sp. 8F]